MTPGRKAEIWSLLQTLYAEIQTLEEELRAADRIAAPYLDERFCDHCNARTEHNCRDSGHERDSSADYQECLTCHWYCMGMSGEYHPPLSE